LKSNPEAKPDERPLLTIGAVAALARKRPSSIRYYERIGLLPAPPRVSGQRRYSADTVRTLAVIDTAQRAGLTLDEIRALLAASPGDSVAVERLREIAERKLPEIIAQIERSQIIRGWLECAARCECPNLDDCPLFEEGSLPAQAGQVIAAVRSAPLPRGPLAARAEVTALPAMRTSSTPS
jgi:MerR family transcriptional regulator, redox-sensitive transcriptional activator SoxR